MKLDLHTHYDHTKSFDENVDFLSSVPLDGMAICAFRDIEYVKDIRNSVKDKLIIVGQELLCKPFHVLGLGLNETIDCGLSVENTISEIRAQDGLSVIAHPMMGSWNLYALWKALFEYDFDALEGYNSLLAPLVVPNRLAQIAARGRNIPSIATSDAHVLKYIGSSYIEIPGDCDDLVQIIQYVRSGKFTCRKKGYIDLKHYWVGMQGMRCPRCSERVVLSKEVVERRCHLCDMVERSNVSCASGRHVCEKCFLGIS